MKFRKTVLVISAVILIYLLLLLPEPVTTPDLSAEQSPFLWNQDALWEELEASFLAARTLGCAALATEIENSLTELNALLDELAIGIHAPDSPLYTSLEESLFNLASRVAACPDRITGLISTYSRLRDMVKQQSINWNMNSADARHRIYRLLYGARAALEEVMLQAPAGTVPALITGYDEPSQTPAAGMLGVTIHSGDILVSRGGAPTSSLIARGNDYAGNFSHVALVHVDENSKLGSTVEAYIECGTLIHSLEQYLTDTKLRIMVLRPLADLPQIANDPLLPHTAASQAYQETLSRHRSYDFEMDFTDDSKVFCSEVASIPYRRLGINLWMGISQISSQGTMAWLGAFGVKNFETQAPSDLEYDPQLRVVVEWRDLDTLWQDHVDNAVIDCMLEQAAAGERLSYPVATLPLVRLVKAYSALLNLFGKTGPIPEGMSASQALRVKSFSTNHEKIKQQTLVLADQFKKDHGYTPPYWELFKLAQKAEAGLQIRY